MEQIKHIVFDAANTLIHKPSLWVNWKNTLEKYGYLVDSDELMRCHKTISECIFFPDRTNQEFYEEFNGEVLLALGIIPTTEILSDLYSACSYLPWEGFGDNIFLKDIKIPISIFSNFNTSLKEKISEKVPNVHFNKLIISEELGVAKPLPEFYEKALSLIKEESNNVLYVGDSIKLDIIPAMNLGMQTLLIDRNRFYPRFKNRLDSFKNILEWIQ